MAFTDYIPIIGDAINLAGGLMSNRANAKENQKNREWSEKMWHLNNEYNLPVNQIQRFRDAGLSAALAYGQGTSTLASYAGNMPASRGYENPAKNIDTAAIAQLHIQDKVANSQVDLNESQARLNEAEQSKVESESTYNWNTLDDRQALMTKTLEAAGFDTDTAKYLMQQAEKGVEIKEEEIIDLKRRNNLTWKLDPNDEENSYYWQDIQGLKLVADVLNARGNADLLTLKQQTELIQQGVLEAQRVEILSQANLNQATANYQNALAKAVPAQIKMMRAQAREAIARAFEASTKGELNKAEIWKIANDAEEAYYNGNVSRYVEYFQRFGTSPIAIGIGSANELQPGTPEYNRPTLQRPPIQNYPGRRNSRRR